MESDGDEKVMPSLPSVGRVTKASRTPKRAKGVFIPPADSTTPRRSPRLLACHTVAFHELCSFGEQARRSSGRC